MAKGDVKGAKHDFEWGISQGYRAARIDLANLLADQSNDLPDPYRAVSLYDHAWHDGLPIAAFGLGQLYERGMPTSNTTGGRAFPPDPVKSWLWYATGVGAHEPNALARFAQRAERNAVSESSTKKRNGLFLEAFKLYAEAAERAQDQGWPDSAWSSWRYRRATLARALALEGMMPEAADAYRIILDEGGARTAGFGASLSGLTH